MVGPKPSCLIEKLDDREEIEGRIAAIRLLFSSSAFDIVDSITFGVCNIPRYAMKNYYLSSKPFKISPRYLSV